MKLPGKLGTLLLKHSQITVHWTDGKTDNFPLIDEKTRIGRGKVGNEVAVPDVFQSVSREHLEIRREKAGYRLIDLGSRNGTLVNGIYAKDIYLKDGDEIKIGQDEEGQQIKIVFQMGSEALLGELGSEDHAVTLPPTSGLESDPPSDIPYFKIRWQNGSTNYFPILKDRIIIGRGVEADLRVPENLRFVSGQHAEVQKEAAGYFIRDLKSTNGTSSTINPCNPTRIMPSATNPSSASVMTITVFRSGLLFTIRKRLRNRWLDLCKPPRRRKSNKHRCF
jgi:pSer/pThr/pTyr-binding forkhead associated (FHA) protein